MLYRNGLIMYDHQTESLWSHILGQAIAGEYKGTALTFIPALQTNWQTWEQLHPNTLVVNPRFFGRDSYTSYYASPDSGVLGSQIPRDGDIYAKEYVIGVRLNGHARAYPFSVLNKEPVINDEVGGIPVVVFFDQATASGTVFSRQLADGQTLTFRVDAIAHQAFDIQTETGWNIFTGEAVDGPLKGTQLSQVPVTYAFWFGWVDYHVDGTVYPEED
jgi:hypothetical protein